MADIKIPLLDIAQPTALAITEAGLHTVALLGTKATMSSLYLPNIFSSQYGLAIIVPTKERRQYIDNVIFNEFALSKFTEALRLRYLNIVDMLYLRGAQGVILGCTEIPLLIS